MDPEIQDLLERVEQADRKPFWQCSAAEARSFPTLMRLLFGPTPPCESTAVAFASADGHRVPARLYLPEARPAGLIVFFHGGGWVIGSVDDYHPFTATLAIETGHAVLSVDYRLAPEHPYPLPVQDAVAALAYAADQGARLLGCEPRILSAMGESAGATLATVATRLHRANAHARQIDLQVLAYPVTDAGFDTESFRTFERNYLLTSRDMRWFWDQYCPDKARRQEALASPLQAGDLQGMPRTLLLTAEFDPLRDEGEHYARRLVEAGTACKTVRCEGLVHGFLAMIHYAPSAGAAFDTIKRLFRNQPEFQPPAGHPDIRARDAAHQ